MEEGQSPENNVGVHRTAPTDAMYAEVAAVWQRNREGTGVGNGGEDAAGADERNGTAKWKSEKWDLTENGRTNR